MALTEYVEQAMKSRSEGFTLIEVMMVVVLISILSVASIELISQTLNENRFQDTVNKMRQISNAMMGDPSLKENGARTSFGFLGDIGAIPSAGQGIAALLTNPGLAAWAVNSGAGFGLGWNGPYLHGGNSGTDYTNDGWGNAIVYDPAANPPTLTSYGSDGVAGGTGLAQDIVVTLPSTMTLATTVTGYVTNHYSAYTGDVTVTLNKPNGSGVLVSPTYHIADSSGFFTFANVPFGTRSISAFITVSSKTLGPIVITVDKPNYTVPPGVLDTNP